MRSPAKSRAVTVALCAAVAFVAAGGIAVSAQEKPPAPAPAEPPTPQPAAKSDEPARPAAPVRSEQDAAIRALVDELAKLRAEVAELAKAQAAPVAAPKPSLIQTIPPDDPAAIAARTPTPVQAPKFARPPKPVVTTPTDAAIATNEGEMYVEPEAPVFYEGDVPVYLPRTVYADDDPTLISTTYIGSDPWYYGYYGSSYWRSSYCAPAYSYWRSSSCAPTFAYSTSWSCAPRRYSSAYVGGCSTSYRGYNVPRSRSYVVGGYCGSRSSSAFHGGARFTTHSSSARYQRSSFRGSSVRSQRSFASSMRGGRRGR